MIDHRTSKGLGETDLSLGGHQQNLVCTKTQRKGAVIPQDTEPKLLASVGGSPVEAGVGRAFSQGREHWQPQSWKFLLEDHHWRSSLTLPRTPGLGSVQFSLSVVSGSLQPHELQHARSPYPSLTPGVHPNSCPSSQ